MKTTPLVVTESMRQEIAGAVSEIDLAQIAFVRRMTPAERVRRAADLIDATERVGAFRLRARQPKLTEEWITSPPHIMLLVPGGFDPADFTTDHHSGGPYIMWEDTPYEHLMVPVQVEQSE